MQVCLLVKNCIDDPYNVTCSWSVIDNFLIKDILHLCGKYNIQQAQKIYDISQPHYISLYGLQYFLDYVTQGPFTRNNGIHYFIKN